MSRGRRTLRSHPPCRIPSSPPHLDIKPRREVLEQLLRVVCEFLERDLKLELWRCHVLSARCGCRRRRRLFGKLPLLLRLGGSVQRLDLLEQCLLDLPVFPSLHFLLFLELAGHKVLHDVAAWPYLVVARQQGP